jgi:sec-independent protein translocase protein TatB
VFGSVGFGEIMVLALVAMVVVGPARLPGYARQAGRMLRELRQMASKATADIKSELGPEMANVSFSKMTPQRLVRDVLLADPPPQRQETTPAEAAKGDPTAGESGSPRA